ncbi:unnamed protein product [Rotaria socialis]
MAASTSTPYDILRVKKGSTEYQVRVAYRARIHEYTQDRLKASGKRTITAEDFRLICRSYEILSDRDKHKKYDETGKWESELPFAQYTLQQLAAEPELAEQLKSRLQKGSLRMMDARDLNAEHTTLYCAARACNLDAVYYLAEQGANPDLAQRGGSTALHVCSFYGHPEMVRCLLESGADYRKKNSGGSTPEDECYNDDVRQVFIELKEKHYVQTAADQLDWLKKNINSVKHIDEEYHVQRQTLLQCASKKGYLDIVRWLIESCNANIDLVDVNLNSALHLAAYGGHEAVVEYLLDRGANPLLLNKWCMTAEKEGAFHPEKIPNLFELMRKRNMYDMAAKGVAWWFQYYFGDKSPNEVNDKGINLLYVACRHGKNEVAEWLLNKGADVNLKLLYDSQSTPLHGAVYNEHISTVELLLAHGANVSLKNFHGSTPIDDAKSDEMTKLLRRYRTDLEENKFFSVYLYGDGKTTGDKPLATLQLTCDASYNNLVAAMPDEMRKTYTNFSMARRPLNFDQDGITIVSSACRARYVNTKFIQLPLCLTAHERSRYGNSGYVFRQEPPNHNTRDVHGKFLSKCESSSMKIRGQLAEKQNFIFGDLSFTFPENCANEDLAINIDYIISPDYDLFKLQECVCFFITKYKDSKVNLNDMPIVSYNGEPHARLYNWVSPTPYWFTYRTRQTRLIAIGETHAFVRHVEIIPSQLSLPPDMFIPGGIGRPLKIRDTPVYCKCLKIREHNKAEFPHVAYHGTNIKAIESILMDGIVMPSTVVCSGLRVCPPNNHIARGVKAFGVEDFSNGIFVTPSIHYCSDPAYGVQFQHDDESLIAVLECTVKDKSFTRYKCTVPNYVAHPDDDINNIEWRLSNPAELEIISVLFIPLVTSITETAQARAKKFAVDK